jgi:hypothetical protein
LLYQAEKSAQWQDQVAQLFAAEHFKFHPQALHALTLLIQNLPDTHPIFDKITSIYESDPS